MGRKDPGEEARAGHQPSGYVFLAAHPVHQGRKEEDARDTL